MTKEEKREKKLGKVKKKLDKLLLGVVVGAAVGSILGIALAPKSGKKIRKTIGNKSRETWEKVSEIIEEKNKKTEKPCKEKTGGKLTFWHQMNKIFFRKK